MMIKAPVVLGRNSREGKGHRLLVGVRKGFTEEVVFVLSLLCGQGVEVEVELGSWVEPSGMVQGKMVWELTDVFRYHVSTDLEREEVNGIRNRTIQIDKGGGTLIEQIRVSDIL